MAEEEIGEVIIIQNSQEGIIKWKINKFFNLSTRVDACYGSPEFSFQNIPWRLVMYPNGREDCESAGYIDLGVYRGISSGSPINMEFIFTLKSSNTNKHLKERGTGIFQENTWHTLDRIVSRYDFDKRKHEFLISGCLTVICKMKSLTENPSKAYLNYRKGVVVTRARN